MTSKANIIAFGVSGAVFAGCCVVMFQFGRQMNSKSFADSFMAVWGLSAFVWPLFAVRTVKALLSRR